MTKEGRVVALISMTVFLYGLSTLFKTGSLVFPFPLNELFFLFGCVLINISSISKEKTKVVLPLAAAIFGLFSQEFYWSQVLLPEQMEVFSNSLLKDVFQILHYISIVLWSTLIIRNSNIKYSNYLFITNVLALSTAFFYDWILMEFILFLLVILISIKHLKITPSFNLWVLYVFLFFTKYWSLGVFV